MTKYLVIVSLFLTGCVNHNDSVSVSSSAGCAALSNEGIDIGIVNNVDAWLVNWNSDSLTLKNTPKNQFELTMRFKNKQQTVVDSWSNKLHGLDIGELQVRSNYRYDVPISVATNDEFLLVGYYSEQKYENKQFGLVYIDILNKKIIHTIKLDNRVVSVALSVNGKLFATLEKTPIRNGKMSVIDYFAKSMGHGIPYSELSAKVYDVGGKILCSAKVANDLSYADGYVNWNSSNAN